MTLKCALTFLNIRALRVCLNTYHAKIYVYSIQIRKEKIGGWGENTNRRVGAVRVALPDNLSSIYPW